MGGGLGEFRGLRTVEWVPVLTHFCPPLRFRNQLLPTVPTFAVRETNVSRHNGGTSGAPIKPLRDDRVF